MSADTGPGAREVAHRVFAAEFDDSTLSYSESDEERAPNYVVTPTGARVNRLFAVGVLTEVESVNEETLRGRVVDPSGAFVTYAGQYQPDEQSYLGRTTPPEFVAMTGKARTFEPDDSDAVYTSVRPESLTNVDADTRDRWTVSAAQNTLHRIAVFDAALESGLEGAQLRAALEAAGVGDSLAAGVPKAIEHYGTTAAYLEAVRTLAVQALEQVAGDRDDVAALSTDPADAGPAELGHLPDDDLDLSVPEGVAADSTVDAEVESAADVDHAATGEPTADEDVPTQEDGDASTPEPGAPEAEAGATAEEATSGEEGAEASSDPPGTTAEATDSTAAAGEPGGGEVESDAAEEEVDEDETGAGDLGDFDPDDTGETDSDADDAPDVDDLNDDALTDEERAEVEAEYGTDFTTGSEVDDPGEAGIDVPSTEEDLEDLESDVDGESADAGATTAADETTDESAAEADADGGGAEESGDEPAADVDLEAAAVDAMESLDDDGDGAAHEEVVAAVVDDTGADPDAVEGAIQDALMSGQCYEPSDGRLKAI